MKRIIQTILASFLAVTTLGACQQPEVPSDSFYRLKVQTPPAAGKQLSGILEIDRFTSDGVTGERAIVYTKADSPQTLRQYHYHYWIQPPGRLVQEQIAQSLRAAGAVRQAVMPEMRVQPDYLLKGRLIAFEQALGAKPRIAVEFEAALSRAKDGGLLKMAVYREEEPARDETPAAAVEAFERALGRAISRLTADVANAS
jgi:cholesterol transport system auxiliary component